jgi:hypothetical protein
MPAPAWATLERRLLAENVPACREFYDKYYDARGYVQCVPALGRERRPDDAFENFNRWPELHALGADDVIRERYLTAFEGMTRQYSDAKTTDVPAGRDGMYVKEFSAQSDWMHHGEGLQLFNRMSLSAPTLPAYRERARRFAGFYMGEDPQAPNYDPDKKLIRSMINGSRGPLLRRRRRSTGSAIRSTRPASSRCTARARTAVPRALQGVHRRRRRPLPQPRRDDAADERVPRDRRGEVSPLARRLHGRVAGRMQANGGVIPSFVDLDGRVGGAEGRWWNNAYGWGFSPVNPVTGKREDRNRIPRALVGFSNALLVTGDRKYVDAWRR